MSVVLTKEWTIDAVLLQKSQKSRGVFGPHLPFGHQRTGPLLFDGSHPCVPKLSELQGCIEHRRGISTAVQALVPDRSDQTICSVVLDIVAGGTTYLFGSGQSPIIEKVLAHDYFGPVGRRPMARVIVRQWRKILMEHTAFKASTRSKIRLLLLFAAGDKPAARHRTYQEYGDYPHFKM